MPPIPRLPLPNSTQPLVATADALTTPRDADLLTPRFLALLESELPTTAAAPPHTTTETLAATHRQLHEMVSAPGSGYDKPETILLHSAEEVETLLDVGPAASK